MLAIEQKCEARLDAAWHRFCTLYPAMLAKPKPFLAYSNRLTRSAGVCMVETGEIRLSTKFLLIDIDTMMRQILPHEIAHYVDVQLNGMPKRWHGKSWKKIMLAYGLTPETYHYIEH